MWQTLLKAQPKRQATLLFVLSDDSKTDALIEEIKGDENLNRAFVQLINQIKVGQITVESMMGALPIPNLSKEKVEANLKKLLGSVNITEIKGLEPLLDEAISAKKEGDEAKFKELSEKIQKIRGTSESKLRKNKKVRAKLRVFDSYSSGWVIKFNAVPISGGKTAEHPITIQQFKIRIGKFAKLIDATVEGDTLKTKFSSVSGFIKHLNENSDAKTFYNKEIRYFQPRLEGKEKQLGAVSETDIMVASDATFEVVEPFTSNSVEQYLLALESFGGNISKFEPVEMDNGHVFPSDAIFLERESGRKNSLALNPYGKLLISASFTGKGWFKKFFETVRMNAFVSDTIAERMHYESILEALEDPSGPNSSSLGTNVIPFKEIKLTPDKKQNIAKLKEYAKKDSELSQEISSQSSAYQRNVFQEKFADKFTVKEAKAFEKIYEETENAEYIWGDDLEIVYYDENDREIVDEIRGIINMAYAKVFLDDEEESPESLMKTLEGYEVSTADTTKTRQKQYDRAKAALDEIKAHPDKGDYKHIKAQREQKLKEAKANLTVDEGTTKISLGKLRQTMLNVGDFAEFIIGYSNDEGLTPLTVENITSANVMDKLSPKNSLVVLSRLSEAGILDEGHTDGLIADTFISIDDSRENTSNQLKLAKELDLKMPDFLKEAKVQLVSGFKNRLEYFTKNYEEFFPRKQSRVQDAIREFKKQQLIR